MVCERVACEGVCARECRPLNVYRACSRPGGALQDGRPDAFHDVRFEGGAIGRQREIGRYDAELCCVERSQQIGADGAELDRLLAGGFPHELDEPTLIDIWHVRPPVRSMCFNVVFVNRSSGRLRAWGGIGNRAGGRCCSGLG